MPVAQALANFRASIAQCDNLIVNSHRQDVTGADILPAIDRQQITVSAFLNMFIAWESFLEETLAALLSGAPLISGAVPTKFASPATTNAARKMVIGANRYFD